MNDDNLVFLPLKRRMELKEIIETVPHLAEIYLQCELLRIENASRKPNLLSRIIKKIIKRWR